MKGKIARQIKPMKLSLLKLKRPKMNFKIETFSQVLKKDFVKEYKLD